MSSASKATGLGRNTHSFSYLGSESGSSRGAQMQLWPRLGPLFIQRAGYLLASTGCLVMSPNSPVLWAEPCSPSGELTPNII